MSNELSGPCFYSPFIRPPPHKSYSCYGPSAVLLPSYLGPTGVLLGFYSGSTPTKTKKPAENCELQRRQNFLRATSHGRDRLENGKTSFNNRDRPEPARRNVQQKKNSKSGTNRVILCQIAVLRLKTARSSGGKRVPNDAKTVTNNAKRVPKVPVVALPGAFIGTLLNTN
jgi:hypothetical protein